jgi:ubiquinone/menaquinone biosynthesis C-methylase UbiE
MIVSKKYEKHIATATKIVIKNGADILEIYQLDEDSVKHCKILLDILKPKKNAVIADMGSGIGAVSRKMSAIRTDLSFKLVNNNKYQDEITKVGDKLEKIYASFHKTGIDENSIDCVMFNYSIGYANLDKAFKETARILKNGGTLLVWDLEGKSQEMLDLLGYHTYDVEHFVKAAKKRGFDNNLISFPKSTCKEFARTVKVDEAKFDRNMPCKPCLMRFNLIVL